MTSENRTTRRAKAAVRRRGDELPSEPHGGIPLRYLTVEESAAYIGDVSTAYVWKIAARGDLPLIRIGGRTMVDIDDLDALAQRNKTLRPASPDAA